jgi:hypothetical protein
MRTEIILDYSGVLKVDHKEGNQMMVRQKEVCLGKQSWVAHHIRGDSVLV